MSSYNPRTHQFHDLSTLESFENLIDATQSAEKSGRRRGRFFNGQSSSENVLPNKSGLLTKKSGGKPQDVNPGNGGIPIATKPVAAATPTTTLKSPKHHSGSPTFLLSTSLPKDFYSLQSNLEGWSEAASDTTAPPSQLLGARRSNKNRGGAVGASRSSTALPNPKHLRPSRQSGNQSGGPDAKSAEPLTFERVKFSGGGSSTLTQAVDQGEGGASSVNGNVSGTGVSTDDTVGKGQSGRSSGSGGNSTRVQPMSITPSNASGEGNTSQPLGHRRRGSSGASRSSNANASASHANASGNSDLKSGGKALLKTAGATKGVLKDTKNRRSRAGSVHEDGNKAVRFRSSSISGDSGGEENAKSGAVNHRVKKDEKNQGKKKSKNPNFTPGKLSRKKSKPSLTQQEDHPRRRRELERVQILARAKSRRQVPLFSHLPQYEPNLEVGFQQNQVHPAFQRLGLQYAHGVIRGSNARCIAMLNALIQFVNDSSVSTHTSLPRDIQRRFTSQIQYLTECRPLAISMANAINHVKYVISHTSDDLSEDECKSHIISMIDKFLKERILYAGKDIAERGSQKIQDGDVILTFGCSSSVECVVKYAHEELNRRFRVIVVDSRPACEGQEMLSRLTKLGVECTYVLLNAISYIMKEVNKVFLGAFAVIANGPLISRAGTALVSMMARNYQVPVLVCCETYKFSKRVQTDSLCFNELGNPNDLEKIGGGGAGGQSRNDVLENWQQYKKLKLLNLVYDLTPIEYITMLVTERGYLPPTAVPVVVRDPVLNPQTY